MPTIDEVAQSVHETLAQEWGVESGKDGTDSVAFGSTWCHVSCSPHGDCEVHGNDSVIVCLAAPVLFNVPITDELCRWVATDGDYLFGRVKVHPDDTGSVGTVALEHAILGGGWRETPTPLQRRGSRGCSGGPRNALDPVDRHELGRPRDQLATKEHTDFLAY